MNRHAFTLLPLVLTLTAVFLQPARAQEQAQPPMKLAYTQPGFQHFKIGDIELIALSDGTLPIPADQLFTNAKPAEVTAALAKTYQAPHVDASINAYLIKTGDRLVMVDAGTGELYGPNLNKLTATLKAVGYAPEQITDILITHIHTDHTGGLMDGDRQVFPNATLHIEQKEVDFWFSPAQRAKSTKANLKYFDEAAAKVGPYKAAGRVKTFSGATELFPGIHS